MSDRKVVDHPAVFRQITAIGKDSGKEYQRWEIIIKDGDEEIVMFDGFLEAKDKSILRGIASRSSGK